MEEMYSIIGTTVTQYNMVYFIYSSWFSINFLSRFIPSVYDISNTDKTKDLRCPGLYDILSLKFVEYSSVLYSM